MNGVDQPDRATNTPTYRTRSPSDARSGVWSDAVYRAHLARSGWDFALPLALLLATAALGAMDGSVPSGFGIAILLTAMGVTLVILGGVRLRSCYLTLEEASEGGPVLLRGQDRMPFGARCVGYGLFGAFTTVWFLFMEHAVLAPEGLNAHSLKVWLVVGPLTGLGFGLVTELPRRFRRQG